MAKVIFNDKEDLRESTLPEKNRVTAADLNELKASINDLYDDSIQPSGTPEDGDLLEYDAYSESYIPFAPFQTSGSNEIKFDRSYIHADDYTPLSGDLTNDLSGAKVGNVCKIYHEDGSAPSVPAGWVLMGTGTYDTTVLNIIFAEWVSGTRVEYWITQEA